MKIENRVEVLEQELKILKNEIQSTLLEIREQVLNHYYPELRAEDPPRVRSSRPTPTAPVAPTREGRNNKGKDYPRTQVSVTGGVNSGANGESKRNGETSNPAVPPFSDLFLLDDEDAFDVDDEMGDMGDDNLDNMDNGWDYADDSADLELDAEDEPLSPTRGGRGDTPRLREVNMRALKAKAQPQTAAKSAPAKVAAPVPPPVPAAPANRRIFAALAGWVGDSVAKVGKERTLQVLETYAAETGGITDETRSTITRLTALANDEGSHFPVSNQDMLKLVVALDDILGEP